MGEDCLFRTVWNRCTVYQGKPGRRRFPQTVTERWGTWVDWVNNSGWKSKISLDLPRLIHILLFAVQN